MAEPGAKAPRRLPEQPRLLVTNDDGINAPGLRVLERVARSVSDDVWVVAPETNQSGASHSLTLHRPLRIRQLSKRRFAIDGTPTDCVLLAIQIVMKDHPADLVLSGVNNGGNLGEDVTYSGTVAAAMEATLFNVPAIAFSQVCQNGARIKWKTAEQHAPGVISRLLTEGWPNDVLINVNFPDRLAQAVEGSRATYQGKRKLGDELMERVDPRGQPYVWIGGLRCEDDLREGSDLRAVAEGFISVTPIHLDMTHHASMAGVRHAIG
jgi:5'-nucleotidase